MSLTPSEIDSLRSSKNPRIGVQSRVITDQAVIGCCEQQKDFFEACLGLNYFAGIDRNEIKSITYTPQEWHDWHVCECCKRDDLITKATQLYTTAEMRGIEKLFVDVVGQSEADKIFRAGALWQTLAIGKNSPLGSAYPRMIREATKWAFEKLTKLWPTGKMPANVTQLPYMEDYTWVSKLQNDGFNLVTSKITKLFLPDAQKIIANGIKAKIPALELAKELQAAVGQGSYYHWSRLVRTEMAIAIDRSSVEQYKAAEIPYIKWNHSRTACPICVGYGTTNLGYYKIGSAPLISEDTHPNCMCNKTPIRRLPRGVEL